MRILFNTFLLLAKKWISIQIIENFPGTGYNQSGKIDLSVRDKRLVSEHVWMKKLRTIFPYGLSKRAKEINSQFSNNEPIGKVFPLPRTGRRTARSRNRNSRYSDVTAAQFF